MGMNLLNTILKKCGYCKTYKLWFLVRRRSRNVLTGGIGVITSDLPMCGSCFNKSKLMIK